MGRNGFRLVIIRLQSSDSCILCGHPLHRHHTAILDSARAFTPLRHQEKLGSTPSTCCSARHISGRPLSTLSRPLGICASRRQDSCSDQETLLEPIYSVDQSRPSRPQLLRAQQQANRNPLLLLPPHPHLLAHASRALHESPPPPPPQPSPNPLPSP